MVDTETRYVSVLAKLTTSFTNLRIEVVKHNCINSVYCVNKLNVTNFLCFYKMY